MTERSTSDDSSGWLSGFLIQTVLGAIPTLAIMGIVWGALVGPRVFVVAGVVILALYGIVVAVCLLWIGTMIPVEIAQRWRTYSLASKVIMGTIGAITAAALIAIVITVISLLVI